MDTRRNKVREGGLPRERNDGAMPARRGNKLRPDVYLPRQLVPRAALYDIVCHGGQNLWRNAVNFPRHSFNPTDFTGSTRTSVRASVKNI